MNEQFYLASGSPRRAELLHGVGLRFTRLRVEVPEIPQPEQSPLEYAVAIARAKAQAGARIAAAPLPVLAADTDVSIDGLILGKPRDREDAIDMLLRLSGRTHEVCSAVTLAIPDEIKVATTITRVSFCELTRAQAEAYWATGEPADKAGAYAIQGHAARWVRSIEGSYTGVVGLPLVETLALLAQYDIHPPAEMSAPLGAAA